MKYLQNLLIVFMLTYPIFDMIPFYNSYTTLVRVVITFGMLFWLLFKDKNALKHLPYLIGLGGVVLLYMIPHHLNALNFKSLDPNNFDYSFIKESLQILKMVMPAILLYICYHIKLNKKDYLLILKSWIIIISGTIVVTNLLSISLGSYSGVRISGSILSWFNTNYTYYELASCGFFAFANQVSCILVCMIPISYYFYTKKELSFLYFVLMMVSLLMLGTRVSNIGSVVVLFGILTVNLGLSLIKKIKIDFKQTVLVLILIILYCLMLPFSPTSSREKIYDFILNKPLLVVDGELAFDKNQYILDNYEEKDINEQFILEYYPYTIDPDFWLEILEEPYEKRVDYRYLETSIIKRVVEVNDNKYDKLFGITNNRIQNIFNIERDFTLQYYAYGIIGMLIFFSVYFWLLVKGIIDVLKDFELYDMCKLACLVLLLGIAYMSGNCLNHLTVTLPLIFLIGGYHEKES